MLCDLLIVSSAFRDGNYVVTRHAKEEMENDSVSIQFLEEAIGRDNPKIIEPYDIGCLILGWGTPQEPLHAVVAYRSQTDIRLVTVYRPDRSPDRWSPDYEKRQ